MSRRPAVTFVASLIVLPFKCSLARPYRGHLLCMQYAVTCSGTTYSQRTPCSGRTDSPFSVVTNETLHRRLTTC
eukprot:20210-Eustigmatos_ZCMA.PRE.1